jgi:hypothetical protein
MQAQNQCPLIWQAQLFPSASILSHMVVGQAFSYEKKLNSIIIIIMIIIMIK